MSAAERILQYINNKGISKYRFYKETGFANGFLDKKGNIGSDKCEKISYQYPDISLEWLITGKGEMLKKEAAHTYLLPSDNHHPARIPLYDIETIDQKTGTSGTINVGDLLHDSEAAMRVYGESMAPGYPAGSIIGIKPNTEGFITLGTLYVVETATHRYLKRLYYNDTHTAYTCYSDNTIKYDSGPLQGEYIYPAFEIPVESVVRLYDVTGVIRRN